MALHLTPDSLAAAYEYFRTTSPFHQWRLPSADEIAFRVTRHRGHVATHQGGATCAIEVSSFCVGSTLTLMWVMAHEMIHLHQFLARLETDAIHNADFRRRATTVCRVHTFDPKLFV